MGLRERKKARTRQLISDVGRDLFLEKGFAAVTVAEIAEKAEVAVTTLFNYFPTKEAIAFDREEEIEGELAKVIQNRTKGQTIVDALYEYFLASKLINPPNTKIFNDFMNLVRSTPELSHYFRGMWARYEGALAVEIQKDLKIPVLEAEWVARIIFEGASFAWNAPSPPAALRMTFTFIKQGWNK